MDASSIVDVKICFASLFCKNDTWASFLQSATDGTPRSNAAKSKSPQPGVAVHSVLTW